MAQKMTTEIFLKNKGILKNKPKNYYSKMFNAEFEVNCPNPSVIPQIFANEEDDELYKYQKLIYNCCPYFKDEELHKVVDSKDPYDIVNEVFNENIGEIYRLGNFILTKYGFIDDLEETTKKIKK